MEKKIMFKGCPLHYRDRGEGTPVVLLHGYLEDGRIFDPLAVELEKSHRILIPDLPGHGESGVWGSEHRMEELAGALVYIMDHEGVERSLIIGHSMGGYVLMAFAELFPEKLRGGVLLHSTCFADADKKRQDRDREIELVRRGRLPQIVKLNIPRAFADDNLEVFSAEVARATAIALDHPDKGVVALLNGMKARPDRSHVLKELRDRFMLVSGLKDNYISAEVYQRLRELAPGMRCCALEQSGHMGFIEESTQFAEALGSFIDGLPE